MEDLLNRLDAVSAKRNFYHDRFYNILVPLFVFLGVGVTLLCTMVLLDNGPWGALVIIAAILAAFFGAMRISEFFAVKGRRSAKYEAFSKK